MHSFVNNLDIPFQLSVFAAILERAPGLVAIRAWPEGRLVYINEAGMKMLGTTDWNTIGNILTLNGLGKCDMLPGEAGVMKEHRSWEDANRVVHFGNYERLLVRHEGKDYCFFRVSETAAENGYQLQLTKELQRFGALFDYASIGILVAGKAGEIIMINDFALVEFGYKKYELLGKKVEVLIPQRVHARHEKHRERFNEAPQNRPMGRGLDLFAVRKDGTEFPVEISLSHYENEEGKFVIAYVNNISERKKAEENIERMNNELEQKVEDRTHQLRMALQQLEQSKDELTNALGKEKELNELKSRFVSMASHEFRTPLSTILSSAFLVQQYDTDEEKQRRNRHLQRIVNSANLLTDILNEFLSVGKIEEGKIMVRPSRFELSGQVNAMIQEVQGMLKKDQVIDFNHEGENVVYLDPSLFRHIFMNLLTNAVKFSSAASAIMIKTIVEGAHFSLIIQDQGIGMTEEDQKHLFERFFRGANVSNIQGTGLGLHIVSKYTEMMNGSVTCESQLGKGTTFTVSFSLESGI
ncbi:PAS domain-containing sensor histidine kinase [uncultured Chitinophaga sp.]|uniref:sensor histidine kinase n=1 Tax=uncultured Chitinophaga sp. TaxID=339340 RepID=UPI0025D43324|nr:PAS domain-containing sensor histidine kinase [uncultured Chitinophaga sp.]